LLNKDKQDILKCIKGLKDGYHALPKQIQLIEQVRKLLELSKDYGEESLILLDVSIYFIPIILSMIKELEKERDCAGADIMYALLEIYAENPGLLLEVYHTAPKFAQEVVWKSLTIASYILKPSTASPLETSCNAGLHNVGLGSSSPVLSEDDETRRR
jgi:hypothetical protein